MSNSILERVLSEVRNADTTSVTTRHAVYTSGLITDESSPVLDRVLSEIRNADATSVTTRHAVYTSGLITDEKIDTTK